MTDDEIKGMQGGIRYIPIHNSLMRKHLNRCIENSSEKHVRAKIGDDRVEAILNMSEVEADRDYAAKVATCVQENAANYTREEILKTCQVDEDFMRRWT